MLTLTHLDAAIRGLMLAEVEHDMRQGVLFISPRLSGAGVRDYPELLKEAVESKDDRWLELRLQEVGRLNATETRRKPSGGFTVVKVPWTAAQTIAEGEFNRFYVRALCQHALQTETCHLVVYRAKQVEQPRRESEARIGAKIDPAVLLQDLRANPGVDTALGVPAGPNSGLSVHLP